MFQKKCSKHPPALFSSRTPANAFSEYFTLNRSIHNYTSRTRLTSPKSVFIHRKKIIKFKASQLWNELPIQLKTIRSLNTFKYQLKRYLINKLNTN